MKIKIDPDKCQGHGRCYMLAPDLFDVDDMGHATEKSEEVPTGMEEQAEWAASNCPEQAIAIY